MLKKILIALVAFVALAAAASYLLPSTFHVERKVVVPAAPAAVFATVADLRTWPDWTAWSREADPSCEWTVSGDVGQPGHGMVWEGDALGQGDLTFTSTSPGASLRYDNAFDHGKFQSKGGFDLVAVEGGTEVTWFFGGESGLNPIARWMSLTMDMMVGPDFEEGLEGLAQHHAQAGPAGG